MAYHHGDLPAALLGAVQSTVADYGVSGVSLREVARRAGVSHSAPAHHFGSKAGLLTAFAATGYRMLAEAVLKEAAALGPADPAAEMSAVGQGYVRFAISHPEHFEVMFRLDAINPAAPEFTAARDAAYGVLAAAVGRCAAEGRLHGRSPELVAATGWALAHGLAALWISGRLSERTGEHEPQRLAAAALDLFTAAALPPPQPAVSQDATAPGQGSQQPEASPGGGRPSRPGAGQT